MPPEGLPQSFLTHDLSMIQLEPFQRTDFDRLINWIDNEALLITIAGAE